MNNAIHEKKGVVFANFPSHTIMPVLLVLAPSFFFFYVVAAVGAEGGAPGYTCIYLYSLLVAVIYSLVKNHHTERKRKKLEDISPKALLNIHKLCPDQTVTIRFFVIDGDFAPFTRGLRRDIYLPTSYISILENNGDKVVEAEILHEIGHIFAQDNLKLIIVSVLLRILSIVSILYIPFTLLFIPIFFFVGLISDFTYYIEYGLSDFAYFMKSGPYEEVLHTTTLSLILFIYIGINIPIRNLLQRSCEFLADSFVVSVQECNEHLLKAIFRRVTKSHFYVISKHKNDSDTLGISPSISKAKSITGGLFSFLSTHPRFGERIAAINRDPWIALDMKRTVSLCGILIGIPFLFIVMRLESSLLSSDINITNTVIISIAGIGYFCLSPYSTAIVLKSESNLKESLKHITKNLLFLFVGFIWGIIISSFYFFAMAIRSIIIQEIADQGAIIPEIVDQGALAWVLSSFGFDVPLLQLLLVGIIVAFISLFLLLVASIFVSRELLTWYGSLHLQKYPKSSMLMSIFIAPSLLLLSFLTIKYHTFWFSIDFSLFSFCFPAGYFLLKGYKLFPLIVLFWPTAIFFMGVSSRRKCPTCENTVPGYYLLGRKCDFCGLLLNEWLFQLKPSETYSLVSFFVSAIKNDFSRVVFKHFNVDSWDKLGDEHATKILVFAHLCILFLPHFILLQLGYHFFNRPKV